MHPTPPLQPIRFFHRGAVVEVTGAATTRTVLDWLREDAHCTGTKEGCNEGDCGACTVVIGEPAPAGDPSAVRGLRLRTVNACIQFLPTLHGKALFSIEDLKPMAAAAAPAAAAAAAPAPVPAPAGAAGASDAAAPFDSAGVSHAAATPAAPPQGHDRRTAPLLHPVQQAMVDCHGSQCGFCTPGFVMSLWSVYEHHGALRSVPTRQQLADELSGNLCRCTGYRPILDAGQRMFELPAIALDTAPVLEALAGIRAGVSFAYAAPQAADRFFAPATLAELAALRQALPDAQLLAGCTDIGLWVNKQFRALGDIVSLGAVDELKTIARRGDELVIGAGASLEAAWSALARLWPALTDVWLRFASPPIRNAGTMGGNVANGSPIGDSAPVLLALDAVLELRSGERVRRLPLNDFYLDYMKNRLERGEFVQAIAVPLPDDAQQMRAYKISKRFDCDISALCAGLSITLDGDRVAAVRLAFGGMAATVRRAARAEAALLGRPWSADGVAAAQQALGDDFTPLSDMRAGSAYRLQVARNLLQRFWLETRAENPLPPSATSVWSAMPHRPHADRAEGAAP